MWAGPQSSRLLASASGPKCARAPPPSEARSAIAVRIARAREIQAERLARLGEPELRTIADLDAITQLTRSHIAEALSFRRIAPAGAEPPAAAGST